jgi:AcrR family transcriptional regulator
MSVIGAGARITADTGDPGGTRARVLDSARRLFLEHGYAATSLADIAADVGLTKTAVAYHFHPKEKLLVELVSPALTDLAGTLGTLPTRTRDQRRAFLRRLVEVLVTHRDVIGILAADTGLLALPALGGTAPRELLVSRLLTERATAHERVRAWAAIGAAQVAVARTLDQPPEIVRVVATAAALSAYDS